jgi:hypothetical protein
MRNVKTWICCGLLVCAFSATTLDAYENLPAYGSNAVTSGTVAASKVSNVNANVAQAAGSSCEANGAPDCGGTCSITCPVGKRAVCIPGTCVPNQSPVCTCEGRTYCGCK